MALDKIRLLVNKIRRLEDSDEYGENSSKIDGLYEELTDELKKANITVKLVAKVEKEILLNNVDNWEEWFIDRLVKNEESLSPTEVLAEDICRSGDDGLMYYIDSDYDIEAHVYDKNGKEIYNNKR